MGATVTRRGQTASPGTAGPGPAQLAASGAAGRREAWSRRLAAGPPLLLDGALGTELERRGIRCELPLWSAWALIEAPREVEHIHREQVAAGAEVITADTFRTQARTLGRAGRADRAGPLTRLAVGLARRAAEAAGRPVWVAGSVSPLEDCYHPERVPGDAELAREHAVHARHLAGAGADLLLLETLNTVREAVAAARAAHDTGLPMWVSFVCDGAARLLSGEPLAEAVAAVAPFAPDLVGVNCVPPEHVDAALPVLAGAGRSFAVYANLGAPRSDGGFACDERFPPERFAAHARRWVEAGARAIGGCCGTTAAHIAALARMLHDGPPEGGAER